MENYSPLMGAAAVMKMAVEMAAVSMEKPSGAFPGGAGTDPPDLGFAMAALRKVYIDDIDITTKKGSTLIKDLKETFDNLDKFCLKLNPTKCSFGVPTGELLGFLVSARGIEANPEKIQAIVTMRKPS
ncbi:hypothetical protein QYE76_063038 [Lolium multiflorum]|uniref:Reverse transcriptase domain-containing protein n=1 Tax=Lolium multiflorum TaxID=4521 RepID=A0AAD8S4Z8_LOLMU|nr:hypothetical protein QYE76_063038 [Lolium multiflorum]